MNETVLLLVRSWVFPKSAGSDGEKKVVRGRHSARGAVCSPVAATDWFQLAPFRTASAGQTATGNQPQSHALNAKGKNQNALYIFSLSFYLFVFCRGLVNNV